MKWLSLPPVRWFAQGLTFFVFLVAGLLLYSAIQGRSTTIEDDGPLLFVDEADLDLGTIWQQPNYECAVLIYNKSTRDVAISNLQPSCNCTEVSPRSFSLRPNESRRVNLSIDLMNGISADGEVIEPFLVSLEAQVSRPRTVVEELRIKGFVRRSFVVKPQKVHLVGASEIIDGVLPKRFFLEVDPQLDISELTARVSKEIGDVRVIRRDATHTYEVELRPKGNLPRGPIKGTLALESVLPSGESGPKLEIEVRGQVSGPVGLSPPEIVVKNEDDSIDSGGLNSTTLVSRDNSTWRIVEVSSDNEAVQAQLLENGRRLVGSVDHNLLLRAQDGVQHHALQLLAESDDGRRERLVLPVHFASVSEALVEEGVEE